MLAASQRVCLTPFWLMVGVHTCPAYLPRAPGPSLLPPEWRAEEAASGSELAWVGPSFRRLDIYQSIKVNSEPYVFSLDQLYSCKFGKFSSRDKIPTILYVSNGIVICRRKFQRFVTCRRYFRTPTVFTRYSFYSRGVRKLPK